MFNNRVQKSKNEDKVGGLRSQKSTYGRERLQFFDEETKKAKTAVAELEQRISRLDGIIVDADQAHSALQQVIEADNGKSLENYSAGHAPPDSVIAQLVMTADNSSRAATAAKAALPSANSALENAKAQVVTLGEQRTAELKRVMAMLADADARAYQSAFDNMCRLHDRLVGYAQVVEDNMGDIRRIVDPVKVPRFALPSSGNADADPFLRHRESELTIAESARAWGNIRDRLAADAQADLSDLLS